MIRKHLLTNINMNLWVTMWWHNGVIKCQATEYPFSRKRLFPQENCPSWPGSYCFLMVTEASLEPIEFSEETGSAYLSHGSTDTDIISWSGTRKLESKQLSGLSLMRLPDIPFRGSPLSSISENSDAVYLHSLLDRFVNWLFLIISIFSGFR